MKPYPASSAFVRSAFLLLISTLAAIDALAQPVLGVAPIREGMPVAEARTTLTARGVKFVEGNISGTGSFLSFAIRDPDTQNDLRAYAYFVEQADARIFRVDVQGDKSTQLFRWLSQLHGNYPTVTRFSPVIRDSQGVYFSFVVCHTQRLFTVLTIWDSGASRLSAESSTRVTSFCADSVKHAQQYIPYSLPNVLAATPQGTSAPAPASAQSDPPRTVSPSPLTYGTGYPKQIQDLSRCLSVASTAATIIGKDSKNYDKLQSNASNLLAKLREKLPSSALKELTDAGLQNLQIYLGEVYNREAMKDRQTEYLFQDRDYCWSIGLLSR